MAMATEVRTLKAISLGCVEKEQLKDFLHLVSEKDTEAMRKFIMQQMALGNCDGFDNGEKVNVELGLSSGDFTLIRRNGDVKKYWVLNGLLVQ